MFNIVNYNILKWYIDIVLSVDACMEWPLLYNKIMKRQKEEDNSI